MALLAMSMALTSAKHPHHGVGEEGGNNPRGWEGAGRRGRDRGGGGGGGGGRGGGGGGGGEGSGHHPHLQDKEDGYSRTGKWTTRPPNGNAGRRNVLLHEAVRKLLGFESSPPHPPRPRRQGRALLLPDPRKPPPMPKYVLDLYEKYRSGEMREGGHTLGNTVRSIPAEIGEFRSFLFPLLLPRRSGTTSCG